MYRILTSLGIIVLVEIVVTDLVPLRYRGQWYGVIAAMWACGSVSGPVIGGAFATVQWRFIFWINLPFIAVAMILVPWFLRLNYVPQTITAKLRRVDWIGSVLFIGSITAFTTPLTYGGVLHDWSDWHTLVPIFLSFVGLLAFGLYEHYLAPEPLFRSSVFRNTTADIAFCCTTIHGIILWCLLYYLPLYYEATKGYSPSLAGLALFPATFTVAPVSVLSGILITKLACYRWTIWGGWATTTLGLGLAILIQAESPIIQWVLISLISGIGLGMLFPALQFQLQAASATCDLEFAVAMFIFFRSVGQCLGVALGGVIFQSRLMSILSTSALFAGQAKELAKNAVGLVESIKSMSDEAGKKELQNAYTESLRGVYIALCVLAGVALLLSLASKTYPMDTGLPAEKTSRTRQATLTIKPAQ